MHYGQKNIVIFILTFINFFSLLYASFNNFENEALFNNSTRSMMIPGSFEVPQGYPQIPLTVACSSIFPQLIQGNLENYNYNTLESNIVPNYSPVITMYHMPTYNNIYNQFSSQMITPDPNNFIHTYNGTALNSFAQCIEFQNNKIDNLTPNSLTPNIFSSIYPSDVNITYGNFPQSNLMGSTGSVESSLLDRKDNRESIQKDLNSSKSILSPNIKDKANNLSNKTIQTDKAIEQSRSKKRWRKWEAIEGILREGKEKKLKYDEIAKEIENKTGNKFTVNAISLHWGKIKDCNGDKKWTKEAEKILRNGKERSLPYADIARKIEKKTGIKFSVNALNSHWQQTKGSIDPSKKWPPEIQEKLRELKGNGLTCKQIAVELKKINGKTYTKNSITKQWGRM